MANFRRTTSTTNFLGQREQRRLLMLVLALGLVIVAMQEAAKPERWHWLWQGEVPQGAPTAEPFDTRLHDGGPALAADEVYVVPQAQADEAFSSDFAPGVRAELLSSVRDDTIFRGAEHDAWFHLFELLSHQNGPQLAPHAVPVTFAQLYRQPNAYRGRLVSVNGRIRRALWQAAPKNEQGIEGYYQLWLQPDDNPADPIVVYALQLPSEMPTGAEVLVEAAATGFFFKRWVYEASGQLRIAPVVLARTIQLRAPALLATDSSQPANPAWIVAAAILLAAGALYVLLRRERPSAVVPQSTIVLPSSGEVDTDDDGNHTVPSWGEETRS